MEGKGSPLSAPGSLLTSVLAELKMNTKRIPPVATGKHQSKPSPKKEVFSPTSPDQNAARNGIAEYTAYSKGIDLSVGSSTSTEKRSPGNIWNKFKSPPLKPKRKKKEDKGKESHKNEPGIDSEIQNIIESAFSKDDDENRKEFSDDLEPAVFSPEDTPVRSYSDQTRTNGSPNSAASYQRHHHGSSIHSDIVSNFSENRGFMKTLQTSRSFDSLDDPRYETVSMFSQISDDDPSSDWISFSNAGYGDAISLSSFASADGQLDGKPEKKRVDAKSRAKLLKKQAAAQKEKMGAFLDAAATNATSRIRKFRRPSIKFTTGRAKLQHLANK